MNLKEIKTRIGDSKSKKPVKDNYAVELDPEDLSEEMKAVWDKVYSAAEDIDEFEGAEIRDYGDDNIVFEFSFPDGSQAFRKLKRHVPKGGRWEIDENNNHDSTIISIYIA